MSLHKGQQRNTLRCDRQDGTTTEADVGPGLPAHELALWVAEETLHLDAGFFGSVAAGLDLADLPDRRRLPIAAELAVAEAWARALGAAAAGASTPVEVAQQVREELGRDAHVPSVGVVTKMVARLRDLVGSWVRLPIGETLTLQGTFAAQKAFGEPGDPANT